MKCETSENQFEEHERANSYVSTWKAQKCVSILSKHMEDKKVCEQLSILVKSTRVYKQLSEHVKST